MTFIPIGRYEVDLTDRGYQFERFITRSDISYQHIEHIQLLKIADTMVLFTAESDGIDLEKYPIEIKLSNNQRWQSKTMFQMISNGSTKLYHGVSKRQGTIHDVDCKTLSDLINEEDDKLNDFVQNILKAMRQLENEVNNTKDRSTTVWKITFQGDNMILRKHDIVQDKILLRCEVLLELYNKQVT